jgi:hypothetical protein
VDPIARIKGTLSAAAGAGCIGKTRNTAPSVGPLETLRRGKERASTRAPAPTTSHPRQREKCGLVPHAGNSTSILPVRRPAACRFWST